MLRSTGESEWRRFAVPRSDQDREPETEGGEAVATGDAAADEVAPDQPEAPQPVAAGKPTPAPPPAPPETKEPAASLPPEIVAREAYDAPESLIGEHSFLDGNLKSEGPIRVCGTIHGQVESQSAVLIDTSARVKATVIGAVVTVAGRVEGAIYCRGRVELLPNSQVSGDVTAGTLIIREGALFEGQLTMASGARATTVPRRRSTR